MNIWEHQAEAKALAAAEKVEAAAAKEAKVLVEHNEGLGGKIVDELKSAAGAVENFVHEHLGAASPQGSSVPATPEQTPPAEVHAELSEERKAELLAEMKALEAEIVGL